MRPRRLLIYPLRFSTSADSDALSRETRYEAIGSLIRLVGEYMDIRSVAELAIALVLRRPFTLPRLPRQEWQDTGRRRITDLAAFR